MEKEEVVIRIEERLLWGKKIKEMFLCGKRRLLLGNVKKPPLGQVKEKMKKKNIPNKPLAIELAIISH